jgi:hypothetical protein
MNGVVEMKFFITAILSAALLFSLSACGGGSSNDSASKKQTQPKTANNKQNPSTNSSNSNTKSSNQTNQEPFYGTWTIKKVIASSSGGGTYSSDDIKALTSKQLTFSKDSATCFGDKIENMNNTVSDPVYKKTEIAKNDFPSDYRVSFNQLGITGNTVTEVDATGKNGICTVFFIISDNNKLILYGGGTFFELDKYSNQNNSTPESVSGTNNIKNVKGFSPNNNQSFTINLKSWGNVKFVSGKITGGNHIPTVFYLTNQNGDILYNFDDPFPYNVVVKAVSFEDVNKDGLKDIIIIVSQNDNAGNPIAAVWLQNANKTFTLDTSMNATGNNKNIKTVRAYLTKKY